MKKIIAVLGCIALGLTGVNATDKHTPEKKVEAKVVLEKQLASYLSFPEELQQASNNGVVVIEFKVSDQNRLSKVVVHSGNDALNANLIKQLTGRKIKLSAIDAEETYTARLHFNVEKGK